MYLYTISKVAVCEYQLRCDTRPGTIKAMYYEIPVVIIRAGVYRAGIQIFTGTVPPVPIQVVQGDTWGDYCERGGDE